MNNKKTLIVAIIFCVVLAALLVLRNYTFVTFTFASDGTLTTINSNGELSEQEVTSGTTTNFQESGSFTFIFNSNENTSSVVGVDLGGFMYPKSVDLSTTKSQQGRVFVPITEDVCISQTSTELFSYSCSGPLSTVTRQGSADGRRKTTNIKSSSAYANDIVEAIYETPQGVELLAYSGSLSNPRHDVYIITTNDETAEIELIKSFTGLGGEILGVVEASKGGITLKNGSGQYYSGVSLSTLSPTLSPDDIKADSDGYIRLGNNWVTYRKSVASQTPYIVSSTSIFSTDDKQFEVNGDVIDILSCNNHIVVIQSNQSIVLDENLNKITSLATDGHTSCSNDTLYLVINGSLIAMNKSFNDGFIVASSDQLDVTSTKNSLINVYFEATFANKNFLVYPTSDSNMKPDIDLEPLTKTAFVDTLSIFGNSVTIVSDLGELVYNPATQKLEYDPDTVEEAKKKVGDIIENIKQNTTDYRFNAPILEYYGLKL